MRYVTAILAFFAFIVVMSLVWASLNQRESASLDNVEPQACIAG